MSVFVNEPRIASWAYGPVAARPVEQSPDELPVQTTYDPAAGTVVVSGDLFATTTARRVLPTAVTVDDEVLSVRFDELDGVDEHDRGLLPAAGGLPFSLSVRFETDLPGRTEVTYVAPDGRRISNWPNSPVVTADDD